MMFIQNEKDIIALIQEDKWMMDILDMCQIIEFT